MRRLPFSIIRAAHECDPEAVSKVFQYFEGFIAGQCLYTYEDDLGGIHTYVDEDLQYDAGLSLYAAIFKFEFREPPESFTL